MIFPLAAPTLVRTVCSDFHCMSDGHQAGASECLQQSASLGRLRARVAAATLFKQFLLVLIGRQDRAFHQPSRSSRPGRGGGLARARCALGRARASGHHGLSATWARSATRPSLGDAMPPRVGTPSARSRRHFLLPGLRRRRASSPDAAPPPSSSGGAPPASAC